MRIQRIRPRAKVKAHPRTECEGSDGEQKYSSILPCTSVLDGVGGQRHAPAAVTPAKIWYPYRGLGWPHGRPGRVQKISPLPGFDPRTVQSVVKSYTDYTNLAQGSGTRSARIHTK